MSFLKRPLVILLIIELVLLYLGIQELRRMPDGKLHVYFLDVGQGDSALIITPSGRQIVIDGGPDGTALSRLGEYLPFFDRSIDLLVLSHPHLDHLYAFPDIVRRFEVGHVLLSGMQYNLPRYREFLRLLKEKRVPVWIADPTKDIDFGDGVIFDVVWPPPVFLGKSMDDVNNASVALRLLYADQAIFFAGDAEAEEERDILASGADISATVLKAGHHGSKTSSGTGFLLAVDPKLAVISAGRNNKFKHPDKMVMDRFKAMGIETKVTATEGAIEVEW